MRKTFPYREPCYITAVCSSSRKEVLNDPGEAEQKKEGCTKIRQTAGKSGENPKILKNEESHLRREQQRVRVSKTLVKILL